MTIEVQLANPDPAGRVFLTWRPTRGTVRLRANPGPAAVQVRLANRSTGTGGQVEFAATRTSIRTPALTLSLPASGAPVEFWVAGVVGRPSAALGDAAITVTPTVAGAQQPVTKQLMVRVRKNANLLTPAERKGFTDALGTLNNQGTGLFADFREMHRTQIELQQAHGRPGFLAWHRAYLLDLERELQKIDPSVSLPYWKFDQPAPNVFAPDLMGLSSPNGPVTFAAGNRLLQWRTDGVTGISRGPMFNPLTGRAFVRSEAATLAMGGARPNAMFDIGPNPNVDTDEFHQLEGDPHGVAHTSFRGWLSSTSTAPRDPLFFLLHCNVDRLWARWQWFNNRFDGTSAQTYFYRGSAASAVRTLIGHNRLDTMWPWNDVTGGNRPPVAPRTPFPEVPTATAPGPAPTVGDMIDYLGVLNPAADMNFAYDDVPHGIAP